MSMINTALSVNLTIAGIIQSIIGECDKHSIVMSMINTAL